MQSENRQKRKTCGSDEIVKLRVGNSLAPHVF